MASSSIHQWKYDVFLSFRGEDTRTGFIDHLYAALRQKGIDTFMDDQLRRGEQISPALLTAIENSRISVIVFSENYASSSWCLDELAKILDCVNVLGRIALPVFYKVDPSHVKRQEGCYAEAFAKHEQIYMENMEKLLKWKAALTEVATISGWDSRDRLEAKLIEEIVGDICNKLDHTSSIYTNGLVGMESRVKKMADLLCIGYPDVRMVGLWGMAGIGKTTIAKAVYERIYALFEGCCFLSNVREESRKVGLSHLQIELLSQIFKEGNPQKFSRGINFIKDRLHNKKVLIMLDDVDQQEQLEGLVGNRDWFGPGSRIIITTRDRHLLTYPEVNGTYEATKLENDEAIELFCRHAFRQKDVLEDFRQICGHALDYTRGLPLALKVLGSSLYTKSKCEWESELEKLKKFPNQKVQNVLKTSLEGLDKNDLGIFLDVAFFYKGQNKDFVGEILESCGFFFRIGIRNLVDKSLITIAENKLWMHDLLQETGWEIVKQESEVLGEHSRLRVHADINHVLTTTMGSETIEGIFLNSIASKELNFNVEAFAKMKRLRLLIFCNVQIDGMLEYLPKKELYTQYKLHLYGDFKFLSNELRSLYWHGYPLNSLPSNFHPEKLVELNMCFSQLKQLWEGNKAFQKLKFMKLSHSQHLTKTPDFFGAPNLERLILEGCTNLVEVHPSIGFHKKLIFLNLDGCKNLKSFSNNIHMESLRILTLSGCFKLNKFPEVQGNMEYLPELSLEGTSIKGLPSSIENLTGLTLLNMKDCKSLESIPSSIFKLKSLKTLILSNCSRLKKLPEIQENKESLRELFLDGSAIPELPSSIGRLNGLVSLNMMNCKKLESLPQSICELTSLRILDLCGCSELKELPDDLGSLQCLVELKADGSGIQEVPHSINLLTNLRVLSLAGCKGAKSKKWKLVLSFFSSPTIPLQLPSFSGLKSLTKLNLSDCNLLEGVTPIDLTSLSSLVELNLSRNNFITIPTGLSGLSRLERLILTGCTSLRSLPELPPSIQSLIANDCTSLETFSCSLAVYATKGFRDFNFEFSNCHRLMERNDSVKHILQGIQLLTSRPEIGGSDDTGYVPGWWENNYDVVAPGSRIPEWFVDQSMGCSVKVELPSHWLNTKLLGMAVCVVVGVKGVIDPSTCPFIHFNFDDDQSGIARMWHSSLDCSMKSDHMWFGYRPLGFLLFVYGSGFNRPGGTMVVSFGIDGGEKLEVRKCGVRLVYKGEETYTYCTFPHGAILPERWRLDIDSERSSYMEEGDESVSGSIEILGQTSSLSKSDSYSSGSIELICRLSCSPSNLLTNFFMLLKHICGFQ